MVALNDLPSAYKYLSAQTTPPIDEVAAGQRAQYSVDMLFTNPEHAMGNPMFAMLCPSHQ
ncbi:unnamed protein product, partial [Porites lobata]